SGWCCRTPRSLPTRRSSDLLLCKIHLKGFAAEPNFEFEFDYFLRGRKSSVPNASSNSLIQIDFLNNEQCENITSLSKLTGFKNRSEEHTSELQSRFDLVCRR